MNIPINYCTSIISPELNDYLLEYGQERPLARHSFLLKAGEICKNIYFVEAGLLRCFYRKGNKEISSCFAQEGQVCWSPESFFRQEKGIEYIQALEDSIVSFLSYRHLQIISLDFPEFSTMEQTVTKDHLLAQQRRMQGMWMQSSGQRLAWFVRQYPGLLERAPGKHIASYVGITEVMLSRLRNAG